MAHANNFEDYIKGSVIDLSNIENNRTPKKETEGNSKNFTQSFLGSKLWLDLELDKGYYMFSVNVSTCLQFCYETNFKEHMSKSTHESSRKEMMSCHTNCLNKLTAANDLLEQALSSHPRFLKNKDEGIKIQQEIKKFNQKNLNKL